MKRNLKILSLSLALCMSMSALASIAACADDGKDPSNPSDPSDPSLTGEFNYIDNLVSEMSDPAAEYNSSLYYFNNLDFGVADPSVIYITEGKDKGWFYAYGTSDEINCHGFQAWRSKDLAHWETTGVALWPDFAETWASDNYWAPEVIYDAEDELYYMVYNAWNQNEDLGVEHRLCLSVAYSADPAGPFVTPTRLNEDGDPISPREPVIDLHADPADGHITKINTRIPEQYRNMGLDCALDASPFVDPATGEKYLYFGWYGLGGVGGGIADGTHLFGMKMKDWFTPDYSSITELTAPGYEELGGSRNRSESEGHVNEGPFMYYHGGKYYLTFSVNDYTKETYHVVQAIADSPLGHFVKVDEDDGGKVISSDTNWNHIKSAGHHSFIELGDELFIAYHTFKDRLTVDNGRALAVDKVVWTENNAGQKVMHTNGPSWSLQPLPAVVSGYKNIAPSAEVTASATAQGSDKALLTDGIIKYQEFDIAEEYEADPGKSVIELKWDNYKTVRGLMIYNSYDYFYSFVSVDKIEMEYLTKSGSTATAVIEDLDYDWDWFLDGSEFLCPGGAAIAEFAELPVKSIKITITSPDDAELLAINEIVVLGKDTPCAGVDGFAKYTFTNPTHGSPHIINESRTFGNVVVDGAPSDYITTMYGYDLSHDDGTADAYIEQKGSWDQYAFFKDVFSTKFYAKATFTVTADKGYANDQYPKFGFAIRCEDNVAGIRNTIAYFVDGQGNFTMKQIGCVQRNNADNDWLWGTDHGERRNNSVNISYKNGNTVTLEVIRDGDKFYFFCNGAPAFDALTYNFFTADRPSAVGFFGFNTPMKITNYSATQDPTTVAEKLAELNG